MLRNLCTGTIQWAIHYASGLRSAVPADPITLLDVVPPMFALIFVPLEFIAAVVWGSFREKPIGRLLLACVLANVISLPLFAFWMTFNLGNPIPAVVVGEVAVFGVEAVILRIFPGTDLRWREAIACSAIMNGISLLAGVRFALH